MSSHSKKKLILSVPTGNESQKHTFCEPVPWKWNIFQHLCSHHHELVSTTVLFCVFSGYELEKVNGNGKNLSHNNVQRTLIPDSPAISCLSRQTMSQHSTGVFPDINRCYSHSWGSALSIFLLWVLFFPLWDFIFCQDNCFFYWITNTSNVAYTTPLWWNYTV